MYELDLSGGKPDNVITAERKIIANCNNVYRCFIPDFAPFYTTGFELTQIVSGKKIPLVEGVHYSLGHYYQEGAIASKKKLYGSVMLLEPLTGVLEFTRYSTMGGASNTSKAAIAQHLGEPDLIDPRNIDWSTVLRYSTVVIALDKPESYAEALSSDEIISELEALNKVLTDTVDGVQNQSYQKLRATITRVQQRMIDEGYYSHPDDPKAHNVSITTLGTYAKEGTVDDTLKAFGKSLDELLEYCIAKGVTQTEIDRVMDKHTALKGEIQLMSAEPIKIPGSGVNITESDTGTTITAKGSLTIQADKNQQRAGIPASLHSGTHILSVYSAGTNYRTVGSVTINGFRLIDKYSLADYLDGYSASTAAINLQTRNTPTVTLSGRGTTTAPLRGDASFPTASRTQKGLMAVTNTMTNMPAGKGCSTRILYEIDKTISQYALGIYTLNGKPLTSDVNLTLADFNLGKVNNTRLEDKELSAPWLQAVANKAVSGHVHPMDQEYRKATPTQSGTVMLSNTKGRDVVDRAATVGLAKQYLQEIQTEAGKRVNIMVGRTLQLGQVPENAPKIVKNGLFIAFVVQE